VVQWSAGLNAVGDAKSDWFLKSCLMLLPKAKVADHCTLPEIVRR